MASGFFGKLFRSKKTKKNKDKFVENEDEALTRNKDREEVERIETFPTEVSEAHDEALTRNKQHCDHDDGVERIETLPTEVSEAVPKAHNMRLWSAAMENRISDVQQSLKDGANIDFKNPDLFNYTPLHIASRNGHEGVVKVLLDSKADVSAVDEENRTTLHCASVRGHEGVAKILLENGGDPAAVDRLNRTALHNASRFGHEGVAKILLENGSDPTAVDKEGDMAFHVAAKLGKVGVLSLLVSTNKTLLQATNKERRTPMSILKEDPTENDLASICSGGRKKCLEMLKSEFNIDDSSIKDTPDLPTSSAHEDKPMKEDAHARNSENVE